jgi:hypothetical protein
LRVALVEVGPDETPCWAPVGDPLPALVKGQHGEDPEVTKLTTGPERITESYPAPEVRVDPRWDEATECTGSARPRLEDVTHVADLPLPSLLLGQALVAWPGPDGIARIEVCPACGSVPLRPHVYCLVCDRWGLDELAVKFCRGNKTGLPRQPFRAGPENPRWSAAADEARASSSPGQVPSDDHRRRNEKAELDRSRRKRRSKARRRAGASPR